jgi:flavin reductase (DIM6/NTAB) family NADH-FMN oxidoreductase RutF
VSDAFEVFDELVGGLDYPMFIATATNGEERSGCLVGFATQSSIDPPRWLMCMSKKNRTYRVVQGTDAIAVHLVPDDAGELAELFGGETGDEIDKFARTAWSEGPEGLPLLDECDSWFAGRVLERLDCGDHVALLLEPFAARNGHGDEQFPFHRAKRIDPGHEA